MLPIFDSWSQMRSDNAVDSLHAGSVQNYRFIWQSWLNFLAKDELRWDAASSDKVRAFLQSIKPSAKNHTTPSTVSQKRYARILREIYAFAVITDRVAANPVTSAALISFTEQHESTVFTVKTWEKIKNLPIYSDALISLLAWEDVRNNAILHLLVLEGLQVIEIQDLLAQDCLMASAGVTDRIAIRGVRPAQNRVMLLSHASAIALNQWLRVREAKLGHGAHPQLPLFMSRKQQAKLSAKSVFWIAREYLNRVLVEDQKPGRLSPGVIRNTRISEWLQTEPPELVARKAGLQDVNSLSRLLSD